jgi:hypothetical protein
MSEIVRYKEREKDYRLGATTVRALQEISGSFAH